MPSSLKRADSSAVRADVRNCCEKTKYDSTCCDSVAVKASERDELENKAGDIQSTRSSECKTNYSPLFTQIPNKVLEVGF